MIPFDANLYAQTSDKTYDLEEWDLNIVATSRQSTDASREGSADYKLTLKDVCWDLPLTAAHFRFSTGTKTSWIFNVWEPTQF